MTAQWKMVRLVAVSVCIALIVPPGVMADNKSSGGAGGSSFSASDASYAEVAAIAYAELRDSAGIINAKIRSVGGAEKSKIILYSDSVFGQLTALDIASSQIASLGTGLCSLSQGVTPPPKPPQPAGGGRYAVAWSGEIGSILSGMAAIAQMFAQQSASVSTSLTPDDDALKADLADVVMTSKSEIIFPDLFLPPLASKQTLPL